LTFGKKSTERENIRKCMFEMAV